MDQHNKHMLIAIVIVLLVIAGMVVYFDRTQPKPDAASGVQFLQMEGPRPTYNDLPPIVYNSQLDVYLDSLSVTQAPTIFAPTPTRPVYFEAVKDVIEIFAGTNNPITKERTIYVNQTENP
jgi:hypothetical protein